MGQKSGMGHVGLVLAAMPLPAVAPRIVNVQLARDYGAYGTFTGGLEVWVLLAGRMGWVWLGELRLKGRRHARNGLEGEIGEHVLVVLIVAGGVWVAGVPSTLHGA
jgi:hypothetical protein